MQSILLILHIVAAVAIWTGSLYALTLSRRPNPEVKKMKHTQLYLSFGAVLTAILGLGVALSFGAISVSVCAKLGLYTLPVLISIFVLQQRISSIAVEQEADS